jgi:hypothetical protein
VCIAECVIWQQSCLDQYKLQPAAARQWKLPKAAACETVLDPRDPWFVRGNLPNRWPLLGSSMAHRDPRRCPPSYLRKRAPPIEFWIYHLSLYIPFEKVYNSATDLYLCIMETRNHAAREVENLLEIGPMTFDMHVSWGLSFSAALFGAWPIDTRWVYGFKCIMRPSAHVFMCF